MLITIAGRKFQVTIILMCVQFLTDLMFARRKIYLQTYKIEYGTSSL